MKYIWNTSNSKHIHVITILPPSVIAKTIYSPHFYLVNQGNPKGSLQLTRFHTVASNPTIQGLCILMDGILRLSNWNWMDVDGWFVGHVHIINTIMVVRLHWTIYSRLEYRQWWMFLFWLNESCVHDLSDLHSTSIYFECNK